MAQIYKNEDSFLLAINNNLNKKGTSLNKKQLIKVFKDAFNSYFQSTTTHSSLSTDPDLQIGDHNFENKLKVLKEMIHSIASKSSTNAFFNNDDSVLEFLKIDETNDNKNRQVAKNYLKLIAYPQVEISMKSTAAPTG